jgi:hypothetical protein
VGNLDWLIDETNGVSAAFIRELLRKATLLAIEDTGKAVVSSRHLRAALYELNIAGGQLTRSLLGARKETSDLTATME